MNPIPATAKLVITNDGFCYSEDLGGLDVSLSRRLKFDAAYSQLITYDSESQGFSNGFRPTPRPGGQQLSKGKVLIGSESESFVNELYNAEKELMRKLNEIQTKNTVMLRCYFDKGGSFMNALEAMPVSSSSITAVDHKQCTMVLTEVRIPPSNNTKNEITAVLESLVYFVIFPVTKPEEKKSLWMVRTVPVAEGSFEYRLGLPERWRALEQNELRSLSQIPDINFVHQTGFIGGCETQEGALRLVHAAFTSSTLHPSCRPQ